MGSTMVFARFLGFEGVYKDSLRLCQLSCSVETSYQGNSYLTSLRGTMSDTYVFHSSSEHPFSEGLGARDVVGLRVWSIGEALGFTDLGCNGVTGIT